MPLTTSYATSHNACSVPFDSVVRCAEKVSSAPNEQVIIHQCKAELHIANNPNDWRAWAEQGKLAHLQEVMTQRQLDLRAIPAPKPLLVVLMPVPKVRRNELTPLGLHEFTLATLKPLVDDGTIILHDFTRMFDDLPGGDCGAYWDLHHQNAAGQKQLTDRLLPILAKDLYQRRS